MWKKFPKDRKTYTNVSFRTFVVKVGNMEDFCTKALVKIIWKQKAPTPTQHVWNLFKWIRMFTVAGSTKVQSGWNNRTRAKCWKFMSQILYVIMQLVPYSSLLQHVPVCCISPKHENQPFATCYPHFRRVYPAENEWQSPRQGSIFLSKWNFRQLATSSGIIWEI